MLASDGQYVRVQIRTDADIVGARQKAREMATALGFSEMELAVVATAISEVARNIVLYAKEGDIEFQPVENGAAAGLLVVASDSGPGIKDPEMALKDGYSSGSGLGLGLPGARRLMDEFDLETGTGGTTIRMTKWSR
ncbi:MAG: ATP-binding protein [Actinomycetota bacterium]